MNKIENKNMESFISKISVQDFFERERERERE